MWRMPIALQRVAQAKVMQTGKGANHGGPSRNSDEEEWFIKVRIVSFVVTASLILAFVFLVSTHARANKANTPATPAEPHPQIREALGALRRAKEHMERAAHDFGGHRVDALRATEEAIRQLEICLKFDKD
ncbi:MAG: hypothetical protein DMG38_18625 [Acidobacteria bacterium]|nr:MAG: hypothetical protein DMG38_18625 [Acidobacteriota bacterium]